MAASTFQPPWGDETLVTDRCRLHYTEVISADLAGGPAGWIDGRAWLTHQRFAFRPASEPAHFWAVTLVRSDLSDVSVVDTPGGARLRFTFRALRGTIPCELEVDDLAAWTAAWREPATPAEGSVRTRLQGAIERGEEQAGRYVHLLLDLSFPRGDWHVELIDDMREVCGARLAELGIVEQEAFWTSAEDIARQAGEAGEEMGRGDQIAQICSAVGRVDGRRFRHYATLPDWPEGEPVWLWLSDDEDRRLRELGVLSPASAELEG